jgi:ankyrin repeat protein
LKNWVAEDVASKVNNFTARGTQGKTLLHEAASLGCLQTFMIVQEQVENKNPKDKLGNTPLHQAVLFGHVDTGMNI